MNAIKREKYEKNFSRSNSTHVFPKSAQKSKENGSDISLVKAIKNVSNTVTRGVKVIRLNKGKRKSLINMKNLEDIDKLLERNFPSLQAGAGFQSTSKEETTSTLISSNQNELMRKEKSPVKKESILLLENQENSKYESKISFKKFQVSTVRGYYSDSALDEAQTHKINKYILCELYHPNILK